MKDQYFGDVNDFRKYGLLRSLAVPDSLRLGICWMLTNFDRGQDGKLRSYLTQAKEYRHRDPELFDWLVREVRGRTETRTAQIESSGLFGDTVFFSTILSDDIHQRKRFFRDCALRFAGRDLLFFDPDNGLEVQSTRLGCRNSCKYLYWHELRQCFAAGSSVLVYQHFAREKRVQFIHRMIQMVGQRLPGATVFAFRTPRVLFLLASQPQHVPTFRRQLPALHSRWSPKQIEICDDPATFG